MTSKKNILDTFENPQTKDDYLIIMEIQKKHCLGEM